jgi:hypothetical protein
VKWRPTRARTLDRYSHALPTMQTEAMARLDAVLGRADGSEPELWLDEDPAA